MTPATTSGSISHLTTHTSQALRIVTYNVNGIRAALKKGFADWLATHPADVVCLQEVKARREDVDLSDVEALGYTAYWNAAQRPGYSGVAILSKPAPDAVFTGIGSLGIDEEGRVLRADYGDLTVVTAYFPNGGSGEERLAFKMQWLDDFREWLHELSTTRPNLVVCGDYNICHREIDIHDPVRNATVSGFLPKERAWMDTFFDCGFVDTIRHLRGDEVDLYTWWSFRAGSRERNKGWRLDYVNVSEGLRERVKEAHIWPHVKHSDHCPVYLELA